ncbi:MAG: hypothetical protein PWR26_1256, partial [Methanosarcinales archaeon]|nr:hypothetical protein [Methanosarcinales archaeon]MDN5295860.1 hypothetical protein [Methanosarcinales archaeon]
MERDGRKMRVHRAALLLMGLAFVGLVLALGVVAAPAILSPAPATPVQTFVDPNTGVGDALMFSIGINESANVSWYVNGTLDAAANQTTYATYSNATLQNTVGVHTIMVEVSNANGTDNHTWMWTVSYAPPHLTGKSPQSPVSTTTGQAIEFNITSNQTVDFTWYVDNGTTNTRVQTNTAATSASYTPSSSYTSTPGTYTVSVVATNPTTGLSSSESWAWTVSPPSAPSLSNPSPSSPLQSYVGDPQPTFSIDVDQNVNVSWWVNGRQDTSDPAYNATGVSGTLSYTPDTALANTSSPATYTIEVRVENANGSDSYSWTWNVLAWGAPAIIDHYPNTTSTITSIEGATVELGIKANQTATIYWVIDGTPVSSGTVAAGEWGRLIKSDLAIGTHTVSAYASNSNGTSSPNNWTWKVVPKTYFTGDSVWRQGENSPTYTWTTQSFAGFYYDIDDDVGSEQIVFKNIDVAGRKVAKGDIVYTTSPSQVHYNYSTWGKYEVIGFMADKYFAGYLDMPNGTGTENPL